ncbi:EF-hand [Hesseltinella vesiculosa]|uniref:EF-hand n=1 Tax=Hesseltinella vesiculosa TaxID=101127 RepID=A0A1X2G5U5_9FUNG|nr:EF-hand [Hesseltinella vesiculosa]
MSLENWQSQLDAHEFQVYSELFAKVDTDNKSIVLKDEATAFFQKASIPNNILTEIWSAADKDSKGFLTKEEFSIALKLIACAQHGKLTASPILKTSVPLPQFEGISTSKPPLPQSRPPSRPAVDTISQDERNSYIQLFQSSNPVNGILSAVQASTIFRRSNLPQSTLQQVWNLADTRKSGTLNQTEFIIGMHYTSALVNNTLSQLPTTLPADIYAAATGRLTMALNRQRTTAVRSPVQQHLTGPSPSLGPRPATDLSRSMTYTAGTAHSLQTPAFAPQPQQDLHISQDDYIKYKGMFQQLVPNETGCVSGMDAVHFFRPSKLPEADLAAIWDLCDTRSAGELNENEFVVAMHLVRLRMTGAQIPTVLPAPPADLVSKQPSSNPPSTAFADAFGLDTPVQPQRAMSPFSDTFSAHHTTSFVQQQSTPSSLFPAHTPVPATQQHHTPQKPIFDQQQPSHQTVMFENASTHEQVATENKLIDSLRSQEQVLDDSIESLKAELDREQKHLMKLKGTAEELERRVEARTKKRDELQKQLKMKRQETKHYKHRVDAAKDDLAQVDMDIHRLQGDYASQHVQEDTSSDDDIAAVDDKGDVFALASTPSMQQDVFSPAAEPATTAFHNKKASDPFAIIQSPSSRSPASPPPMNSLKKKKAVTIASPSLSLDDDLTADIEAKFPDLSTMEHTFDTRPHPAPSISPSVSSSKLPANAPSPSSSRSLASPTIASAPVPEKEPAVKPSKYGFDLHDFESPSPPVGGSAGPSINSIRDDLSSLYNNSSSTPASNTQSPTNDAKDDAVKPSFSDVFFS